MKMKYLINFLISLFLLIPIISFGQSTQTITILNIGGAGFVTIDHEQYPRGQVYSFYSVTRSEDTTLQITGLGVNAGGKKWDKYLDGDNSNTPFASGLDLLNWMNSNFEAKPDTIVTGGGGGGGVSSVGLSAPSSIFSVSGTPITTSGTLGLVFKGGLAANKFLATPDATTGIVGLRSIVVGDLSGVGVTYSGATNDLALGTKSVTAANLSGVNTGDQDLSTYALKTTSLTINGVTKSFTSTPTYTVGDALVANSLSQFATTTSDQFRGIISNPTGTGSIVFGTSPSFTTPSLGVASATSINKVTLTSPATGCTVTIADGKTFKVDNSIEFSATDNQIYTLPTTSCTLAARNRINTFTDTQKFSVPSVYSWASAGDLYINTAGIVSLAPVVDFSVTASVSGFSVTPTINIVKYTKKNSIVHLWYTFQGSGNIGSLTFTLPFAPSAITGNPTVSFWSFTMVGVNPNAGKVTITRDGSTLTATINSAIGSATFNAGSKFANGDFFYETDQ